MRRIGIACVLALCMVVGVVAGLTVVASAQDTPVGPAEEYESATSFQDGDGPQIENVPGGLYMVLAYGCVALFIALLVGRIALIESRTAALITELRGELSARKKALPDSESARETSVDPDDGTAA